MPKCHIATQNYTSSTVDIFPTRIHTVISTIETSTRLLCLNNFPKGECCKKCNITVTGQSAALSLLNSEQQSISRKPVLRNVACDEKFQRQWKGWTMAAEPSSVLWVLKWELCETVEGRFTVEEGDISCSQSSFRKNIPKLRMPLSQVSGLIWKDQTWPKNWREELADVLCKFNQSC